MKLSSIMLIDDNEADNYLNKLVIEGVGAAKEVFEFQNGIEALCFLSSDEGETAIAPDLILLDINMPRMNGWEFLEEYEQNRLHKKMTDTVIVLLSGSSNPDDQEKASGIGLVKAMLHKPLTGANLTKVLGDLFKKKRATLADSP